MFGFFAAPGLSTASFLQVTADQPQAGNHICIRPCRHSVARDGVLCALRFPKLRLSRKSSGRGHSRLQLHRKSVHEVLVFAAMPQNKRNADFFFTLHSVRARLSDVGDRLRRLLPHFSKQRGSLRACEPTASQPLSCCCWGRCGRDVRRLQPCSSVSWSTISRPSML